MRWEGSKGTVGAREVQVPVAEDGRVGGGPRFWGTFGFLRLAIVPQGLKALAEISQIAHHFSTVHSICFYVCAAAAGSDFAHGEIFGRSDLESFFFRYDSTLS